MEKIAKAIQAWENGQCSNEELAVAIKATEETLCVLRAFGANWVMTVGLQNSLSSMKNAMQNRI